MRSTMAMCDILLDVSWTSGVPVWDILGRGRCSRMVAARQEVMRRCRLAGYSYPQIGKYLGRDHTTVLYAIRKGTLT